MLVAFGVIVSAGAELFQAPRASARKSTNLSPSCHSRISATKSRTPILPTVYRTISSRISQKSVIDPAWDPLRKDPRFQALIDKYAAAY